MCNVQFIEIKVQFIEKKKVQLIDKIKVQFIGKKGSSVKRKKERRSNML